MNRKGSQPALFGYRCSVYYNPETEFSVRWDAPAVGVDWPLPAQVARKLSQEDQAAPFLSERAAERLPAIEDYP